MTTDPAPLPPALTLAANGWEYLPGLGKWHHDGYAINGRRRLYTEQGALAEVEAFHNPKPAFKWPKERAR